MLTCAFPHPKGELVRDAGSVTRPTNERREENRAVPGPSRPARESSILDLLFFLALGARV